ncbi:MAG: PIN domain-containing protein [Bacteroidota bacterium]|nr:PIN domain-containing protein [Bacteroidota bacterium]
MDIVLVDTSVWVNFFKGRETGSSLFLKNNLSNIMIATCPVIVQEVLQGIVVDKEFKAISSYFNALTKFSDNPYELALDAARLYREIRKAGFTIRKANDCLIASYAIKNNVRLLHDDKDFYHIAMNSGLMVQPI